MKMNENNTDPPIQSPAGLSVKRFLTVMIFVRYNVTIEEITDSSISSKKINFVLTYLFRYFLRFLVILFILISPVFQVLYR